jgi:deoxyribodipyrimidine photo-lyase
MTHNLVWFKRDLRVADHGPLRAALVSGPTLALYCWEPSVWQATDASSRQAEFVAECLHDLLHQCQLHGIVLHVAHGEVLPVLERLHGTYGLRAVYSHEETGNAITYARDRAVAAWLKARGLPWHQSQQHGVVRGLKQRRTWLGQWRAHMQRPMVAPPPTAQLAASKAPASSPAEASPEVVSRVLPAPRRQRGGREAALAALEQFLQRGSARYRGGISSPLSAPTACSRLSPYLAWGCLSMREVVQATERTLASCHAGDPRRAGLRSMLSRLHWHCHFIQKLESEPAIEWRNMHPGYNGLREDDWQAHHFDALTQGRTGWPLVDACVAMLGHTGWLNFRMRAMLVSVAAYPLWLHWREVGLWLARQLVDYEPGIHWSQMQMQAGTTGINTTRVYNPIKQARDHDPQGQFVRHWLPVLRRVPDAWVFEPWRMPASVQQACGVRVGHDWPLPPVDLAQATRQAKARIHQRRAQPEVHAGKQAVLARHTANSGKPPARLTPRERRNAPPTAQTAFDF